MRDDLKTPPTSSESPKRAGVYQKPTVAIDASEDVKRSAFGACCALDGDCDGGADGIGVAESV